MEKPLKIEQEEQDVILGIINIIDDGNGVNGAQLIRAITLGLSKWYFTKNGYSKTHGMIDPLISGDESFIWKRRPGQDSTIYKPICSVRDVIDYLIDKELLFRGMIEIPHLKSYIQNEDQPKTKRMMYKTTPFN